MQQQQPLGASGGLCDYADTLMSNFLGRIWRSWDSSCSVRLYCGLSFIVFFPCVLSIDISAWFLVGYFHGVWSQGHEAGCILHIESGGASSPERPLSLETGPIFEDVWNVRLQPAAYMAIDGNQPHWWYFGFINGSLTTIHVLYRILTSYGRGRLSKPPMMKSIGLQALQAFRKQFSEHIQRYSQEFHQCRSLMLPQFLYIRVTMGSVCGIAFATRNIRIRSTCISSHKKDLLVDLFSCCWHDLTGTLQVIYWRILVIRGCWRVTFCTSLSHDTILPNLYPSVG